MGGLLHCPEDLILSIATHIFLFIILYIVVVSHKGEGKFVKSM